MSILRKLSAAPKEKQTDEIITLSIRPLNVTLTDNQSINDVDLDPSNAHEAQNRGSIKFVDTSNKEENIYSQEIPVDLKHIDFVLVHKTAATTDKDEDKTSKQLIKLREAFEKKMMSEGLVIYKRKTSDLVFTIIHCPFKRLCIEAEKVKLQLPLKDMGIKQTASGIIQCYTNKYLETEKNVVKFICTPLIMKQFHFFENHEDPDKFFMTAIRSLLVHNILIKCDIRSEIEKLEEDTEENIQLEIFEPDLVKVQSLHMKGLNYMLMKKAYIQCFPLHEESQLDTMYTGSILKKQLPILTKNYTEENDIRLQLNKEWTTMFRYQPIWKIRCYFGEKIAFYFAWAGMFITTLWVPMVIGWIVFSYGLYQRLAPTQSLWLHQFSHALHATQYAYLMEFFNHMSGYCYILSGDQYTCYIIATTTCLVIATTACHVIDISCHVIAATTCYVIYTSCYVIATTTCLVIDTSCHNIAATTCHVLLPPDMLLLLLPVMSLLHPVMSLLHPVMSLLLLPVMSLMPPVMSLMPPVMSLLLLLHVMSLLHPVMSLLHPVMSLLHPVMSLLLLPVLSLIPHAITLLPPVMSLLLLPVLSLIPPAITLLPPVMSLLHPVMSLLLLPVMSLISPVMSLLLLPVMSLLHPVMSLLHPVMSLLHPVMSLLPPVCSLLPSDYFTSPLKKKGTEDEVDVINSLKRAFDNKATPIFALFMCCWGTIFLEVWKQYSSRLAFEWSVESFEYDEPKRPQFYGTKIVKDPVTEEEVWFYPYWLRAVKFFASGAVLFFMVITVVASVSGIIVYRVIVSVDYCPKLNGKECFLLTSVASSVLNALSITLLVHIYDKLALYLTEWENHRTQTDYDNALIVKLFAFRFVNSYSSCFYIAFLREYVGILDKDYVDTCHGSCMSQLTIQIMVLIITSMVPKFLIDIGYTIVRSVFLSFGMCDRFTKAAQVLTDNEEKDQVLLYIEKEFLKRDARDITLSEFTEKVILYGYLMIFAASFPLAPMFVIGLCFFDMRLDASRLLRFYKRPVAHISQNIGIWYAILNFLNIVGVTSNAFLIAFTSSWGQQFNTMEKLIVVIIFEHLVFALKFFLAILIPDESFSVNLAKKRKKYVVQQRFLMEEDLSKKQERREMIGTDPVDDLNKDTENDSMLIDHF
ncbi:anoctamin-6-like isoform X1 [Biomphalaria pfeifferi]|uniref:Anoctamin n=1 Tax=Biomphalaria pfeifferi TaxID=112525 RepID=A0AAD8BEA0_BIOPF|nr:anoctamin-6-like isoform X1 [Biomphalaria pfeifferi]